MSDTVDLTEELAAAVDRLDYPAIEDLTKSIGESILEPHTAEALVSFLRMITVKIMLKRAQREATALPQPRSDCAPDCKVCATSNLLRDLRSGNKRARVEVRENP